MPTGNKKKAYTLAEVMIVLLVLTILFAAMAPLITKKRTSLRNEDLWSWSARGFGAPMNTQKVNVNGTVFFGITPTTPDSFTTTFLPRAKVIIRSGLVANNSIQRQLQLRYGDNNDGYGSIGGTMLADNENLLFGNTFKQLKDYDTVNKYPKNNLAFGYNALERIQKKEDNRSPQNNTAFGYNALYNAGSSGDVAIGANAGSGHAYGYGNVFIGSEARSSSGISDNTLIGYNSQSGGVHNTFIGAYSGNKNAPAYNTSIGFETLNNLTSGSHNIAIGSGALNNLVSGSNNVAIGYNACEHLTENVSNKTCIGYNSGPKNNIANHIEAYKDDSAVRTYIGEAPKNTFGGDAVLEIHNMGGRTNTKLANNPKIQSDTTTVINGNLIVKGNTYFTTGNILYPYTFNNSYFGVSNEQINEPCAKNQTTYDFGCGISLSSDRRLKYIGKKSFAGLDELNKIQVYNYKYKNDTKKETHTGVIAQYLQKVFPASVSKDKDGYLRIRWDEMFYACINAIKTLNQRITSLAKRTLSLENEVDKLEKENAKLKAEVDSITKRVEKLKNNY